MDDSIKPRTPADGPAPEDTEHPAAASNVVPINNHAPSAAAAIMDDPAMAAEAARQATPQVIVQRTLDILPGLVGALDSAIKDQTGKHQPFVLLIFAEGGTALHSANFDPKVAQKAVIELAHRWDTGEEAVTVGPGEEIPSTLGGTDKGAANDDDRAFGQPHRGHGIEDGDDGGALPAGDEPHVTH